MLGLGGCLCYIDSCGLLWLAHGLCVRPWLTDSEDESCSVTSGSDQQVLRQDVKTLRRPPEFQLIVIRAGLNETFTFTSCVICNWLSYLMSSHLRRMCAPSHLRSSHLRSSYPISSHLRHICASSYLRSLFHIFTSSLSPPGLQILKPHFVSTSSDLHHVVALSYLIIFKTSPCICYYSFTT